MGDFVWRDFVWGILSRSNFSVVDSVRGGFCHGAFCHWGILSSRILTQYWYIFMLNDDFVPNTIGYLIEKHRKVDGGLDPR